MVFKIEDLKEICKIILAAVETNTFSVLGNTLELKVENNVLSMGVTNQEYFLKVLLPLKDADGSTFHATIDAAIFLKLISKMDTENVDIEIADQQLVIKGNGTYKLPIIYDGDEILTLPEIAVGNPTTEFEVSGDILASISKYNAEQLRTGMISQPIQKMFYVDNEGAMTFTSGACVNKFTLDKPVQILLNERLVKLFNLFKGLKVNFTLGQDVSDGFPQTKVKFETDRIILTSIIQDNDEMIQAVPIEAVRARAFEDYPYSIIIDRNLILNTIDRLMIFPDIHSSRSYCKCQFEANSVKIYDPLGNNFEEIPYANSTTISDAYETMFDLVDIKNTFSNFKDQYISMRFGNKQALVINSKNIYVIVPEVLLD